MKGFGVRLRQILYEEWNSWTRSKKDFRKLDPVDIVIFDACGADYIEQCLPVASVFILHVRGEKFHVNPKTLWLRLWFFIKYRRPRWSYYLAILQQLNPKVVITFIDNNVGFHQLSNHFTNSTFISVQNGWHFPSAANPLGAKGIFSSTMITFGENDVINWLIRGVKFRECVVAGSLKASLFLRDRPDRQNHWLQPPQQSQSVLYISQFRSHLAKDAAKKYQVEQLRTNLGSFIDPQNECNLSWFHKWVGIPSTLTNEAINVRWLVGVFSELSAASNQVPSFSITPTDPRMLSTNKSDPEGQYFEAITPLGPVKLLAKACPLESYEHVLKSDVVVSSGSALAQEALGMGKKVLLSQPVASPLQAPDFNIPWWLINHRYEDFKQALIDLLGQTDAEYQSTYKREITYYSGRPTAKPTYELVRDEVISALAKGGSNQD